jgi:hypothetical protein
MRPWALTIGLAAVGLLGGCTQEISAPGDRGVCWHMVQPPKGPPKFNVLARDVPDLEHCAAQMEKMRINFQSLGLTQQGDLVGAYQTQFLFLNRYGAFTSQTLTGFHYPFLVRTGDGRLAVPGAMPQNSGQ